MPTITTQQHLLDQARRKLTPTLQTIPGMGMLEEHLRKQDWPEWQFSEPPAGSGLKPIMGNSGLPFLGHLIEIFRGGPDFVLESYRKYGPVYYTKTQTCASEGYTGTKLEWCKNICERGYTGSTLAMWIRRWTDRYRTLPYCAVETQPALR